MYFKSKKVSLVILGITSAICSRGMFSFFNDPEGTNLLVTVVMAIFIFAPSYAVYVFFLRGAGLRRLLLAVLIQMLLTIGFYFLLR